ncbi:hypothetical protein GCM10011506_38580 [Marivirga lumbricoides]|uniref:DUF1640 domain-containing protein n=1 Tax=Marivirga lumbricoides TaxID=1046115 RepID=A0ABQ1N5C0_9BACT|nr:hypothetical protein GCM10011506_38580 [Marivirga lumbricoides]
MTEDINKLIDINLNLICSHKSQFSIYDFQNLKGDRIGMRTECKLFSDEMEERDLIKRSNEFCTVKEFGLRVHSSGGWLKYKFEKEESERIKEVERRDSEKLEHEIKLLQKDNLKYQSKIRLQESRIRNLNEQLKIINLLKSYWWLIATFIGVGMALRELLLIIL